MRGSAKRPIAALAALLLGATGCTICPDPFDYSGPVPDGSAAQNDFRLRANGILPLGSHPLPWPPVVQAAPRPEADSPTAIATASPGADEGRDDGAAADSVATSADESVEQPADVQPVAAEASEAAADVGAAASPRPVATAPAVIAVPDEPRLDVILPPTGPQRPEIAPPLRETPGWKPRS